MTKKALALLVAAAFLFAVSSVFAYNAVKITASGGSYTTPDGDIFYWDNFTIPLSKSIGPAGSIIISGTSGGLGVLLVVLAIHPFIAKKKRVEKEECQKLLGKQEGVKNRLNKEEK
jgi:hypothetical protein